MVSQEPVDASRISQSQPNSNMSVDHIGQVELHDSSLYVTGVINHQQVSIMLDTGAAVTVLKAEAWRKSGRCQEKLLRQVTGSLRTASGDSLHVLGSADIQLRLGGINVSHPMVIVEDLHEDCLLGSDFFSVYGCQISFDTCTLTIGDTEIPLRQQQKQPQICRVIAKDKIAIPSGTEVLLTGKIQDVTGRNEHTPGILQEKSGACSPVRLAHCIVIPENNYIPVRIANFSSEPARLKPGQVIGWFYPLESINTVNLNVSCVANKPESNAETINNLIEKLKIPEINIPETDRDRLVGLISEYSDVFSQDQYDLGRTSIVEHSIDTGTARPIKQPPRRVPPHRREALDKITDQLLKHDLIKPSTSPWSSPVVLAQKHDGTLRFCVDYRKLNRHTVRDAQPIPRIDDTLEALSGSKWFSCLDLASGYWQTSMKPSDCHKTAFVTHRGQFEWQVMPFGVTNGPASFMRLMNMALDDINWKYCLVYLDDVVVFASNLDEHLHRLRSVFQHLRKANLKLKPEKCKLLKNRVKFLGHVVSHDGIETDPDKTEHVRDWPEPTNISELRSFLGLTTYYKRFVPNFAQIAEPLYSLTRKGAVFQWASSQQTAFDQLKSCLTRAPILAYPDFRDSAGVFVLDTDASDVAIGGVLSQRQKDGSERVIAYGSRTLQSGEQNYCATRREMLALVTFIEHFRYYLLGKMFIVRTDHRALKWLLHFREPCGQVARWIERLQDYEFQIEHRPGRNHGNADALSRKPRRVKQHGDCPSCGQTDRQELRENIGSCASNVKLPVDVVSLGLRTSDIVKAQNDDPDIAPVLEAIRTAQGKPSTEDLGRCSQLTRSIWAVYEFLVIRDGCLHHRSIDPSGGDNCRLVLPVSMIEPVLERLHAGYAGGHLGMRKTDEKVRRRFWRPGLKAAVTRFCRSCVTCQKCKSPPRRNKASLQSIPTGRPNQRVHIDIVGPLPRSKKGNIYILVAQDAFTKWPEAWPLRTQKAKTCARIFVNGWITRYGTPETLHSDRGSNFESTIFKEMCNLLDIDKTRTTAYHPQCNGQVENLNKSIKSMLTAMVNENGTNWDEHLPASLMAYRSSVQLSTQETPFVLMFGRQMRLPLDIMLGRPANTENINHTEFVSRLQTRLEAAYRRARAELATSQKRQREYYDRNSKDGTYRPGDEIWLRDKHVKPGDPAKFHKKWKGPYKVLERLSEVTYRVVPLSGRRRTTKTVHFNDMKLSHSLSETVTQIPRKQKPTAKNVVNSQSAEEDKESEPSETEEPYVHRNLTGADGSSEIAQDSRGIVVSTSPPHFSSEEEGLSDGSVHPSDCDSDGEPVVRYNLRARDTVSRPVWQKDFYLNSCLCFTRYVSNLRQKKDIWIKKGKLLLGRDC